MPTFYQTSAAPRGRRRKEESENQSSSRPPGQSLHRLSKTLSRSTDERAISRNHRAASPGSFVAQQPTSIDSIFSQKSSTSNTHSSTVVDSQSSLSYLVTEEPVAVRPTSISTTHPSPAPFDPAGCVENYRPSELVSRRKIEPIILHTASPGSPQSPQNEPTKITPPTSRPTSPITTDKTAILSHSSEDTLRARSRRTSSSSTMVAETNKSFQPVVPKVIDDLTPTPTPVKSQTLDPLASADTLTGQSAEFHTIWVSQADNPGPMYHHPVDLPKGQTSQRSSPAPPAMSPPQSPTMFYNGAGPTDYAPNMSPQLPQYAYPYPTHMPLMPGSGSFYSNPYYNHPFPRQFEEPQLYEGNAQARSTRSASDDDREQLLQKVSNVLPDIHRLLNEYKGSQRSSSPDITAYQSETTYKDQLDQVKVELEANKKEYEKVIQGLVGDRRSLEHEVTALQSKVAELRLVADECETLKSQAASFEAARKELADDTAAFRESEEKYRAKEMAQANEIASLKSTLQSDKEIYSRRIADLKDQHKDQLTARERDHHQAISRHKEQLSGREREHQRTLTEHKSSLSKVQLELAGLTKGHAIQKQELDSSQSRENDLKVRLDAKSRELTDVLAAHATEIEALTRASGEIKVAAEKQHEELGKLRDQRRKEVQQLSVLASSIGSCRARQSELQKEHENLDRIMQDMGVLPVDSNLHQPASINNIAVSDEKSTTDIS